MTDRRQYLVLALAVFAVVGGVAFVGATVDATAAATQSADNSTNASVNVTVESAAQRVGVGHEAEATVGVTDAQNGVSAYELVLGVENGSVASIGGISVAGEGADGPVSDVEYSDNETRAVVEVALLDAAHGPANETDLLDVALAGDGVGSTALEVLDVRELADGDVQQYDVGDVHNDSVEVVPSVSLGVDAAANEVDVGGNVSSTVSVQGAVDGVGEYDVDLSVSNSTVGTITDVTLPDGTPATAANVTYEDDGAEVSVTVDGSNVTRPPAETIDLLDVVVEGTTPGQTQVEVASTAALRGVNDTSYFVESTGATTVSVADSETDEGDDGDDSGGDSSDSGDDGSSGGSAGGGGGGTGTASMETSTRTTAFGAVATIENADSERVSFDVDVDGTASTPSVTGLELTPRFEPDEINLYVYEPTPEPSTEAPPLDEAEPVGYVELDLRSAESRNVDELVVEFAVPDDALPDGSSLEDVAVYRYADGAWTAVETSRDGGASVRAAVAGFGELAVGVDGDATTTESASTTAQTTAPEQTTDAETTAPEQATSSASETGGSIDGFGVLAALAALAGAFALRRRE